MNTETKKTWTTKKTVMTAMFGAISVVLMLIDFPLPIAPSFMKMDISDLPAMLGTFMMGPAAGVAIAAIKNILELIFRGTTTAFVGELANFLGACSYILPAALVYHFKKGKGGAALSLLAATVCVTILYMILDYAVIFPMYSTLYNLPMETIIAMGSAITGRITDLFTMMVFAVAPFNLIKYGIVSLITFFTYKRLKGVLLREEE